MNNVILLMEIKDEKYLYVSSHHIKIKNLDLETIEKSNLKEIELIYNWDNLEVVAELYTWFGKYFEFENVDKKENNGLVKLLQDNILIQEYTFKNFHPINIRWEEDYVIVKFAFSDLTTECFERNS